MDKSGQRAAVSAAVTLAEVVTAAGSGVAVSLVRVINLTTSPDVLMPSGVVTD